MRLLLIKDGTVANAIRVAAPDADKMRDVYAASFDAVLPAGDEPGAPGVGWTWDGNAFGAPPEQSEQVPSLDELRAKAAETLAAIDAALDAQAAAVAEAPAQEVTKS